ncbi:MAG: polyprenyl synthetase family protein [Thermoleophilaceae bacterium]|nr:polyprenyl synthetase family protein [Thermoleophilaceae bacterium]
MTTGPVLEAGGAGLSRALAEAERRLAEVAEQGGGALGPHVSETLEAGGKRLRPLLVNLCGGSVAGDRLMRAAVAVELLHMATLVHDDVLDEAELRRKGATINHLRGNEAAVLLGDYLISHSYHLCSGLDSQLASRTIARTTNEVCEGELLQIHHRNNIDLDEPTYLEIISRKTASLCATCCQLGATFAGASEAVVERLETYGRSLGTAFQIQDDILDIVGDVDTVGKTLGIDVEKGKMTLPMIHFLRTAPTEHRALLRSLLSSADADKAERIRNLLLPTQSIQYAHDRARQLVDKALGAISELSESEAKSVLQTMARFVISRPM